MQAVTPIKQLEEVQGHTYYAILNSDAPLEVDDEHDWL